MDRLMQAFPADTTCLGPSTCIWPMLALAILALAALLYSTCFLDSLSGLKSTVCSSRCKSENNSSCHINRMGREVFHAHPWSEDLAQLHKCEKGC